MIFKRMPSYPPGNKWQFSSRKHKIYIFYLYLLKIKAKAIEEFQELKSMINDLKQ